MNSFVNREGNNMKLGIDLEHEQALFAMLHEKNQIIKELETDRKRLMEELAELKKETNHEQPI